MKEKKRFIIAVSILIGTCIGAGVLGIPYVAAQAGFFVALAYIVLIGLMILLVNLYLGEISLRTKGNHQLAGYARRYLGKRGFYMMQFAFVFGIYAAIIAYILGIGESLSFLIFKNSSQTVLLGVLIGFVMSFLLWEARYSLKKFERWGVIIILFLLFFIVLNFVEDIRLVNLFSYNTANVFMPFGVILFALLSFSAIPEVEIILGNHKKLMKKCIVTSIVVCMAFYAIFTFVVVGSQGMDTPEIATLVLGRIFVVLGIFTMFTSYLALGNALQDNFIFDDRMKKKKAWFLTTIAPIFVFVVIQVSDFFFFFFILSIGGVVFGGLTGILVLFMVKNAKKKGNRKPEYKIPVNKFVIGLLILIFILGILSEFSF